MAELNIILCDHAERDHLLPLTYTRPVGKLRIGIWTIEEKWNRLASANISFLTQEYLSKVFPANYSGDNLFVNGAFIPTSEMIDEVINLPLNTSLWSNGKWIATRSAEPKLFTELGNKVEAKSEMRVIDRNWKIFQWNGWAMDHDFAWLKSNKTSLDIPSGVTLIGDQIFLDQGAVIQPSAVINATSGPIYLGPDSEIMEGSLVRGGLALLDHAQLKMGAKIYGPTTIGPHSKVGGEVNNAVIIGYSNKGHDGFIGNTVIGEWCNLGADTNTSNLKNNYADVKIHNYALNRSESTGGQFCGLTMGDHSKSGINTMFNTGTVCGVFANVFGSGFPHRRIPDFGWGGAEGFKNFRLNEALEVAERVMERRSIELTEDWIEVYTHLYHTLTQPAT
ncbi:MAG: putative sugar nucleotidyl transferase [Flavobacteriales bacterium]